MTPLEQPNEKVVGMLARLAIENPGTRSRYKMAAGIVYRRHLIATGVNSYKTHPLMQSPGYLREQIYMHAEVDAIRNALRLVSQDQLSKGSIYIVRVKQNREKNGYTFGMAKPCRGCTRMIASFGISSVWWSEDFQPIPHAA
jgi:deoxycytidylate deaminase